MQKHMALILAAFLRCLYSGVANAMDIKADVCDNSLLELRCMPTRHLGQPPLGCVFVPPPPKCEITSPPRLHKGHHCGGYHSRR